MLKSPTKSPARTNFLERKRREKKQHSPTLKNRMRKGRKKL